MGGEGREKRRSGEARPAGCVVRRGGAVTASIDSCAARSTRLAPCGAAVLVRLEFILAGHLIPGLGGSWGAYTVLGRQGRR